MRVRPRKMAPRKGQPPMSEAQGYSFPSPIRGLVLNENIAMAQPGGAQNPGRG